MSEVNLSLEIRKQWFIHSRTEPIEIYYEFLNEIGSGAYGKVVKARDLSSNQIFAVKIVQKNRVVEFHTFKQEIGLLRVLDHPNIVRLIECFETERLCYLVLEHCEGGELLQRLIKEKNFSELKTAYIMRKLISAVMYCHNNRICHRDLKPENCLILDESEDSEIKIIDFGLAAFINEEQFMHDICGTPFYVAPEVLSGSYRLECDCWSLGVILYMLLSGTPPFNGKTRQEVITKVYNASYSFRIKPFAKVSEMAKDLISRLLVRDANLRLSARDAFNHPWIQVLSPVPDHPLSQEIFENMKIFVNFQKFKRATMMFIASRLTDKDLTTIKQVFISLDKTGSCSISRLELESGLRSARTVFTQKDVDSIWKVMDTNHNGKIDYIEFLAACVYGQRYADVGILKTAFEFYDMDKDGFITAQELRKVFLSGEVTLREHEIQQMINDVDTNGDGKIDYMEFIEVMTTRNIF